MTDERYTTRRTVLATISGLIAGLGVISTDMAAADQHEPAKGGNAEDEDDGASRGDSDLVNPEDYSMEHDAHLTPREESVAEAYVEALTSPPFGGGNPFIENLE